jgi:hypothetical protein
MHVVENYSLQETCTAGTKKYPEALEVLYMQVTKHVKYGIRTNFEMARYH